MFSPLVAVSAAVVERAYSEVARRGSDNTRSNQMALSVGYSQADLEIVPAAARLGMGCGSPIAAANLTEGETVVDLGSGGGIDIFLASTKVGPRGQAIGIDISTAMVSLARKNAAGKGLRPPHVAFIESSLAEPLPILPDSVNCVVSNGVINLLPSEGKRSIYGEIYRILKPGGRVVIDDVVARKPLSAEILNNPTAYVNCISGACQKEEHEGYLRNAGFIDLSLTANNNDMSKICSSIDLGNLPATIGLHSFDVNEWVASYQIRATKPQSEPLRDTEQVQSASALARWWDAYPKAKSTPPLMESDELLELMRTSPGDQSVFAVIDVRRDDHGGGHVRGSDNWAAQTFHDDLPKFLEKYRDTKCVIFYCGSSSGRGPRCAGWYQDLLDETNTTTSTAYVLAGGVKAWIAKYGDDQSLVDMD